MTTAADLVHETRAHLHSGQRPQLNKLAAAITTTSEDTITFSQSVGPIQEGSTISVGLERMYVWDSDTNAKTATVERGFDGSTATTHTINTVVRVNEQYDDFAIVRALNQDLADLSSPVNGIYRTGYVERTFNSATYGYDLDADMLGDPLAVLTETTGGTNSWVRMDPSDWIYDSSADTTDFASGHSLRVLGGVESGRTLRVVFRAPFYEITALSDDMQDDVELPVTANDIPPLGAAVTLLAGRPARRTQLDSQPSSRRAEEVTAQDALISLRGLLARREQRIAAEAARFSASQAVVL